MGSVTENVASSSSFRGGSVVGHNNNTAISVAARAARARARRQRWLEIEKQKLKQVETKSGTNSGGGNNNKPVLDDAREMLSILDSKISELESILSKRQNELEVLLVGGGGGANDNTKRSSCNNDQNYSRTTQHKRDQRQGGGTLLWSSIMTYRWRSLIGWIICLIYVIRLYVGPRYDVHIVSYLPPKQFDISSYMTRYIEGLHETWNQLEVSEYLYHDNWTSFTAGINLSRFPSSVGSLPSVLLSERYSIQSMKDVIRIPSSLPWWSSMARNLIHTTMERVVSTTFLLHKNSDNLPPVPNRVGSEETQLLEDRRLKKSRHIVSGVVGIYSNDILANNDTLTHHHNEMGINSTLDMVNLFESLPSELFVIPDKIDLKLHLSPLPTEVSMMDFLHSNSDKISDSFKTYLVELLLDTNEHEGRIPREYQPFSGLKSMRLPEKNPPGVNEFFSLSQYGLHPTTVMAE